MSNIPISRTFEITKECEYPSDYVVIDFETHGLEPQKCDIIQMAAIAPFADSPTFIRGIGHIRLQESDRMAAIVENLSRMGIHAAIQGNDIYIEPGTPHAATIETYDDHRVAMAFSLTGLRTPGIIISNPLCCRKTFENYFDVLDAICRNYLK